MDENEFKAWMDDVYNDESNYFYVDVAGKKIKFTKLYTTEDLQAIMNIKDDSEAGCMWGSRLSVEPKLTIEQMKRLPGPLQQIITQRIMEELDMEELDMEGSDSKKKE